MWITELDHQKQRNQASASPRTQVITHAWSLVLPITSEFAMYYFFGLFNFTHLLLDRSKRGTWSVIHVSALRYQIPFRTIFSINKHSIIMLQTVKLVSVPAHRSILHVSRHQKIARCDSETAIKSFWLSYCRCTSVLNNEVFGNRWRWHSFAISLLLLPLFALAVAFTLSSTSLPMCFLLRHAEKDITTTYSVVPFLNEKGCSFDKLTSLLQTGKVLEIGQPAVILTCSQARTAYARTTF